MIKLIRLTTLLILLITAAAMTRAHAEPNFNQTQLRLTGKGIENKKTKESIALTCDTESCTVYRWLYINEQGIADYIGPEFTYDEAKVKGAVKAGPRSSLSHYLKYLNREVMYQDARMTRTLAVGIAGAIISLFTSGTGAILLVTVGMGFSLASVNAKNIRSNSDETYSITNQNGWSWTVNPKKVSKGIFRDYKAALSESISAL